MTGAVMLFFTVNSPRTYVNLFTPYVLSTAAVVQKLGHLSGLSKQLNCSRFWADINYQKCCICHLLSYWLLAWLILRP
jgi:hypothetical protein